MLPSSVDDTTEISVAFILSASAPAILNNAAAPLAAAIQLGLLGHSAGSAAPARVAAFTAVNAITAFIANVANFLIVVTMARVGHAIGAKQWGLLGRTVRVVLLTATIVGCASAEALWLLRRPLLASAAPASIDDSLSDVASTALDEASSYLPAALLRLPPLLILRAASSVLVGYQRVRLASAINTALALVDTLTFYVALHVFAGGLFSVGVATATTCALAALGALLAVLRLPPEPRQVRVCPGCDCAGGGLVAQDADSGESEDPPRARGESLVSLACDSLNVLIRSLLLSGSVLSLTMAAAPLGTTTLNAHAVVLQLWMLTSYVVDGFADVGTMLGSKLLGGGHTSQMRQLTKILAALGIGTGLAASALLLLLRAPLAAAFTRDPATRQLLVDGSLWPLLCVLQPINAMVFVYDGMLYATHSFTYIRNALSCGTLLVFAPALALVVGYAHTLCGVWMAKAGLNCWRCATAFYRIHVQLWPQWTGGMEMAPAPVPVTPFDGDQATYTASDGRTYLA